MYIVLLALKQSKWEIMLKSTIQRISPSLHVKVALPRLTMAYFDGLVSRCSNCYSTSRIPVLVSENKRLFRLNTTILNPLARVRFSVRGQTGRKCLIRRIYRIIDANVRSV